MTKDDREKFAKLMTTLGELLGSFTARDGEQRDVHVARVGDLLDAYWRVLEDVPFADVEEACRYAEKTEEFMPKPAWFRKRSGIDERKESYHFPMPE